MSGKSIGRGIAKGVLFVGFIFLIGWLFQLLWNALIPELFKGPQVTYWQAMGLLLLAKIVMRLGVGGSARMKFRYDWHDKEWREHFREKLEKMSPDEREKVMKRWMVRCNFDLHDDDEKDRHSKEK